MINKCLIKKKGHLNWSFENIRWHIVTEQAHLNLTSKEDLVY